nr:hypothetical protein [uncultured bacterium]
MKKILIPLLLLVFVFSLAENANAQRKKRRKKKEDKEESVRSKRSRDAEDENYESFSNKLVYEIAIGNIALQNSIFGLSLKPLVGYKLHERIVLGIGFKYFYLLDGRFNEDIHLNDIGAFAFTRFKITESFFAHIEYSFISFDDEYAFFGNPGFENGRRNFNYPVIGGGYSQGFGDWKSSIQVLFIGNQEVRRLGNYPIEFWFGFTKNF